MSAAFRYQSLGYLKLQVTNLDRTATFLERVLGLDLVAEDSAGQRFFRCGDHHHDIILVQAATPGLARIAWALPNETELNAAYAHFVEQGHAPEWISAEELAMLHIRSGFRFVDPVLKATLEYYSSMVFLPGGRKNPLTRFQGGKHFGLVVPDVPAVVHHCVNTLGFMVSDYFEGDVVSLLRAWPNPNHHSLAFVQSRNNIVRSHHIAFMVEEIDDIGRLFNRASKYDAKIQFGIGRHPTSGSIHLYLYGPDHFVWEYTLGMEQFPEQDAREPRCMSALPEDFDLWGAVPDTEHSNDLPRLLTGR